MKRRELITFLVGAAIALPLAARAQQANRVQRIGIVMPYVKGYVDNESRVAAFKQALAKLGWAEG